LGCPLIDVMRSWQLVSCKRRRPLDDHHETSLPERAEMPLAANAEILLK
jgi:hypothetical protein